jgi:hypothetical protein
MSNASTRASANGKPSTTLQRLRLGLIAFAAALAAACGSGDSTEGPQGSSCGDCGTALLTMTDAEGDFLSYTVDITSLQLKKANGTVVQTLPATSRIDFAQLVDLSEVLSAGQVPAGEYVSATLGVDFSDAEIIVDDGTTNGMSVAAVDAAGQALGHVDLTVQLDNRRHLLITRKRVSHLAFDLDLAASNTVNLGAHTVTVSPFILASVQPPEDRPMRARGKLASVDVSGSSYTIDLRPFREAAQSSGQLVVHTTGTTRFEINGSVATGATGLTQLAALDNHPVTIAFGSIDATDHSFTATRVLAATSAEDLRRDYLSGNVLARSGNTLTVGGVRLGRRNGHFGFEAGPVAVTIGPNTLVTRDGQGAGTMDIGAISVGQHIEVFGDYSRAGVAPGTVDATAGRVRLNFTHIFGKVATTSAGGVTLALQAIDGRDPARFNFAGTGSTPASDADPAHYEVDTGALGITGLASNQYTRLFGFVTPFGTAAPDFKADTFLDFTDRYASIAIGWGVNGSTDPFSASSATALTLDLTGVRGVLKLGGRIIDVTTLTTGVQLVPASAGSLAFAIAHRGSREVDNFSSFADFTAALDADLNGTTAMYSLVADGSYDSAGGVFTVKRLLVLLGN